MPEHPLVPRWIRLDAITHAIREATPDMPYDTARSLAEQVLTLAEAKMEPVRATLRKDKS